MRVVSLILMLFFSMSLFAETEIKTQIHDIDVGQGNDVPLIFLTSGHVVTYPDGKQADFERLKQGLIKHTWFLFVINNKKEIIKLTEVPSPLIPATEKSMSFVGDEAPYQPSILKSLDEARSFFYDARSPAKEESQCFNRAHVWTYEWRTKRNLYASKVWLFFTRKFIRKYKFEWWFHVAPMVQVVTDGAVKERVMDVKYARGPIKLKQWTDIFMRDNADCPVVQKYTDHADFPESGSCFVMKSSMYYYQPIDLELLESQGLTKTRWQEPEVKHAFMDAFDVTL
jgi:hypothetical protein